MIIHPACGTSFLQSAQQPEFCDRGEPTPGEPVVPRGTLFTESVELQDSAFGGFSP